MAIKREVRYTYIALLKDSGWVLNPSYLISLYDDVKNFHDKVFNNPAATSSFKVQFPPIKTPQYVEWLKKYFV